MNVASDTATSDHQRLDMARAPLPFPYYVPVRRSCTAFLYVVYDTLPCTAYSCQVMAATKAQEADRTRLSKQVVVDRALALADSEGLEALTIRRLAAELGV